MSSGLRLLSDPGLYYVSVDVSSAAHYTVNSNGEWSATTMVSTDKVFKDLGKIVYYDPVKSNASPATAPPVDVRKVAELGTDGLSGTALYIPLGTRVKGTRAQQGNIPPCWVAQTAAGVASTQSGAASSGSA